VRPPAAPARRARALAFTAATFAWLTLAVPADARADGILGAFIGTTFGGATETNQPVFGGVLGGVRPAGLGFEIDFGHSPDFFDTEEATGLKTSVTTVMGNLVFGGAAANGVAPYVSGGIGLIRGNVSDPEDLIEDLSRNDFGLDIGGGVNAMFGSNVGLRADLRYFRSLRDEEVDDGRLDLEFDLGDLTFWRASAGLVLRW
jgi:opacity protein-like surface antigen